MSNNNAGEEQQVLTIHDSLASVSNEIQTFLFLQEKIKEQIKEENVDPQTYFKNHAGSNEIEMVRIYENHLNLCNIQCNGVSPSSFTDTIHVSSWGDFLRLFMFKNLTEMYSYYGIDKNSKTIKYFKSFFDGNKFYLYFEGERGMNKKEIVEIYTKEEILKYFTTEERKALDI